jgi:hypothetical protein
MATCCFVAKNERNKNINAPNENTNVPNENASEPIGWQSI